MDFLTLFTTSLSFRPHILPIVANCSKFFVAKIIFIFSTQLIDYSKRDKQSSGISFVDYFNQDKSIKYNFLLQMKEDCIGLKQAA